MRIRYDIEAMNRIISDLCILTGISMTFLDTERRMLVSYTNESDFCTELQKNEQEKKRCTCSDEIILTKCFETRRFEGHICHAGLFDAAMPIMKDDVFAGTVLMGRIRLAGNEKTDGGLYGKLPEFRAEQIKSLETLLPNVLFEKAVFIEFDDRMSEIAEYIKNNMTSPLSVGLICKKFYISKNTLYDLFKEHLGKTVNEYITDIRLDAAKKLLSDTNAPVYEIAEGVGINNYTYFCKIFKKKAGISPSEYRKKELS